MKITDIETHVLLVPDVRTDETSSAQDEIVVLVHTDEGITGIGETDVNPWIARACIEAPGTHTMGLGLREMLLGENPLETERLWEKLYVGSAMNGRRGAGICAIGALDMALWDIRGKAAGVPTWQLLGEARPDGITPYASLQPRGETIEAYRDSMVEWVLKARELGFAAAKLEATFDGPYRHGGLSAPDEKITEIVRACRDAAGSDFTLMVDVQYAWPDPDRALATLREWKDLDVFFIETPLPVDDLDAYARLSRESSVPVAAGEWQTTRFEFIDLLDRGGIQVAQPDVGRVGGLTEARRVCELVAEREKTIVPHCWKTGIGIAATAQLAAVTPRCAFIEYLPAALCDSALRRDLASDGLQMRDGKIALPDRPGLGCELDVEALKKYVVQES